MGNSLKTDPTKVSFPTLKMKIGKKNRLDEEDISAIPDGIREYNASHAERKYSPFVVTVKVNGVIVAGAQCESKWDWMHVNLFKNKLVILPHTVLLTWMQNIIIFKTI